MADRTVHATYPGMEIVRYDRAGKWYMEATGDGYVDAELGLKRRQLGIGSAAEQAIWALANGGQVFFGRLGGSTFDKKVRDGLS